MIRLWLARGTDRSIREQLRAQLFLGILSGRLPPGERLPSVRALARRLKIHPNTVSSAYQDLEESGWAASERGRGVFVRQAESRPDASIDAFVSAWAEMGLKNGFPLAAIGEAFARLRSRHEAREFLVADPDVELAAILSAEIGAAIGKPVPHCACGALHGQTSANTCLLMTEAAMDAADLPQSVEVRAIRMKAMEEFLAGQVRPVTPVLVGVASRSESILRWAGTLLAALGFPPEAIVLRNACEPGWNDGLGVCHIVAADIVTAPQVKAPVTPLAVRVIAEEFLSELRVLSGVIAEQGSCPERSS
jgi:DNA-binding transcriptional regulator YhcF (GntR family)